MIPAVQIDGGGVLTLDVPETGAISSASVSLFDPRGEPTVVVDAAVTVVGSRLTYAVAGVVVGALGRYRARWSYTIGGVVYTSDRLFEVSRSVARPTLSAARLLSEYAALFAGRLPPAMTAQQALDTAWRQIGWQVHLAGKSIHRVVDTSQLEPAHALWAASLISANLAPGSATSNDWQARAEALRAEAQALLTQALQSVVWHDEDGDLKPTPPEQNVNTRRIIATR
jgi:hypothetical protein